MGYRKWWQTLETLIAEFKRRHVSIPSEVMKYLKSAKTMINVYGADESRLETIPTIENYLLNVESDLMNLAKVKFGQSFMDRWIKKLEASRKEVEPKAGVSASRFIPGLPKTEHWVRVLTSGDILEENVEALADGIGLSWKKQKDGYILVYGSKEKVKDFVKKMAEKCRSTPKN